MKVTLVKAFTKDKTQGNPAGVILKAGELSDDQRIKIAANLGFSESAFVCSSNKADFRIRFFTPIQEVDLCGHATIATIHVLAKEGLIQIGDSKSKEVTIETRVGVLPVECFQDGLIVMTQAEPQFLGDNHDKDDVAPLLGIMPEEILNYPIETVSTGTPKLMITVNSLDTLYKIKPNFEGIKTYCQQHSVKGFYPFTFETKEKDSDFHARQFNPAAGIEEDPITGVAAGALGAYIIKHKLLDKNNFVIEQGYCMGKGGKMYVTVGGKVKVGGYALIFGEKDL